LISDIGGKSEVRTLLLDIETAPSRGFVWGKWEQNVIAFDKHWFLLSFAYQWLGEKKIHVLSLPDYHGYKPGEDCSKPMLQEIRSLLCEADAVVAHNGRAFDTKAINAAFARHHIKPAGLYKQIDTLMMARNFFRFTSNSLDDLAEFLGIGRKLSHAGKDMWLGCYYGDKKQWTQMKKYNAHDVFLLEHCYLRLRPFATNHPRMDYYTRREECPTCQSTHIKRDGFSYVASGKRQLMECQKCGAHWKTGKLIKAA
jgi:RNase_H superfamily